MRQRLKGYVLETGYAAYKIIRAPIRWYRKLRNIQTRGVRIMLINEGRVLLVRHWYNNLWVAPGGGIKSHEIPEQAAARELQEELGITDLQLDYELGTYANNAAGKNDIVHCFVIELGAIIDLKRSFNLEISDRVWCPVDELPPGTSSATKMRLKEWQKGAISEEIRVW